MLRLHASFIISLSLLVLPGCSDGFSTVGENSTDSLELTCDLNQVLDNSGQCVNATEGANGGNNAGGQTNTSAGANTGSELGGDVNLGSGANSGYGYPPRDGTQTNTNNNTSSGTTTGSNTGSSTTTPSTGNTRNTQTGITVINRSWPIIPREVLTLTSVNVIAIRINTTAEGVSGRLTTNYTTGSTSSREIVISANPGDFTYTNSKCRTAGLEHTVNDWVQGTTETRSACLLPPNSVMYVNIRATNCEAGARCTFYLTAN